MESVQNGECPQSVYQKLRKALKRRGPTLSAILKSWILGPSLLVVKARSFLKKPKGHLEWMTNFIVQFLFEKTALFRDWSDYTEVTLDFNCSPLSEWPSRKSNDSSAPRLLWQIKRIQLPELPAVKRHSNWNSATELTELADRSKLAEISSKLAG